MRINVPLDFLDTLDVTQTQSLITKDFSDCLLFAFKLFAQADQPVIWKRLLSNTSFDISDKPHTIESNGAIVAVGEEKLQELMALPPEQFVETLKQILEITSKISLARTMGHVFETDTVAIVGDENFDSDPQVLNSIRHQQAYHAIEHGWSNEPIAYEPSPSDRFNQALDRSWNGETFDDILTFYVNAFVAITDTYELSRSFHLRFFFGEMVEKLTTVAPPHMLEASGNFTMEYYVEIVKELFCHPSMPKYGIETIKNMGCINNPISPTSFLEKMHTNYLATQTIKKQLWIDENAFWTRLGGNLDANTPIAPKNTLVEIITNHYAYPQPALTDRYIAILSQSPYVLKQLFDAGVLTMQKNQNANVVDANAKKYFVYNFDKELSLKNRMFEFLSSDDHTHEELQSAQDLLNIFQRTTLSEHISGTHNVAKRKM